MNRGLLLLPLSVLALLPALAPALREAPPPPQAATAQDGRAAKVLDLQGRAYARSLGAGRWRLLRAHARLLPGDYVRTEPRGANAIELELTAGHKLLLGPGCIAELQPNGIVRVHEGELEITPAADRTLHVQGAGYDQQLREKTVLQAGKTLQPLPVPPRWLTGYRNSTTSEWLGSLLAQVDGREVPLTIGYHDVRVEIQDQIARTTVEQSFVNHTKARLEGTFFFPLPADATVAGFGMWIGNELVEGDLVERQKARRIFEQILRERRDPGLLEWAGGNLFKARVFPIEALSEKRIRLVYTQVLPREGTTVRYRYGLRSELLRQNPLRKLALHVSVASAAPLTRVHSPTHALRTTADAHTAFAEFEAQDHRPEQDFELLLEVEPTLLRAIAHRRGEDGYFLLQLSPPDPRGQGFQVQAAPSTPLQLVLLADTSASCDRAARAAQTEFLSALLGQLGEQDRFALFACDVQAVALTEGLVAATPQQTAAALDKLRRRRSLGWTDLEPILRAAQQFAAAGVQVLYVGDGRATASASAQIELDARITRLVKAGAQVHTVAPGSVFDRATLERIARVGEGSMRAVSTEPAIDAERLLGEITSPTARGLTLRIDGIRTARVHPAALPPLAAGRELVVLGRYWPEAEAQSGKVTVQGTLAGKPVTWTAELALPADDGGNSFLPRLWASRQIDALLAELPNPAVEAQIVACSTEYGIATPFTSLLVLETDEDRERFGVERRVHMRDGEAEFAAVGDRARLLAQQEQMRLARLWRLELRARMVRELATLGEELHGVHYAYGQAGMAGAKLGHTLATRFDAKDGRVETETGREWGERQYDDGPATENELLADYEQDAADELMPMDEVPAASEPAASPAPVQSLALEKRAARQERVAAKSMLRDQAGAYWFREYVPPAPRGLSALGFPAIGAAPRAPAELPATWPQEVRDAVTRLDRRAALAAQGRIGVIWEREDLHALRGYVTARHHAELSLAPQAWLVTGRTSAPHAGMEWCAEQQRGVLDPAAQVGRTRAAIAGDNRDFHLGTSGYALSENVAGFVPYEVISHRRDGIELRVELRHTQSRDYRIVLVIDTEHDLLLRRELHNGDALQQTLVQSEPFAAGSVWLPGRTELRDGKGRLVARESLRQSGHDVDARFAELRRQRDAALLAPATDPELATSQQAAFAGNADVFQQLLVMLQFVDSQRWNEAHASFVTAAAKVPGKPGLEYLGALLDAWSRRGEEFQAHLPALVGQSRAMDPLVAAVFAYRVHALARAFLHGHEMERLLESFTPQVTAAGFAAEERKLLWRRQQLDVVMQLGRIQEAIAGLRELLARHPDRFDLRQHVAQTLRNLLAYDEAIAVARVVSDDAERWESHEREQMFSHEVAIWYQLAKPAELLAATQRFTAAMPQRGDAWAAWLTALLLDGQEEAAQQFVARELAAEPKPDEPAAAARAQAAVSYALGQYWNLHLHRVDPAWFAPLCAHARALVERDVAYGMVQRILGHHVVGACDPARDVRALLRARLLAAGALEELEPAKLQAFVPLVLYGAETTTAQRHEMRDRLRARWRTTTESGAEQQCFQLVHTLIAVDEDADAIVTLLRERHARTTGDERPGTAHALLQALLARPWTQEREDEALRLVSESLPPKAERKQLHLMAGDRIRATVQTLFELRERALLGDELALRERPRDEQKLLRAQARAKARAELAARLEQERDASDDVRNPWYELEALCLRARAGDAAAALWPRVQKLLALPATADDPSQQRYAERALRLAGWLTVRRGAVDAHAGELVAHLQAGLAAAKPGVDWRYQLYRLLLALDRAQELETQLSAWIVPAEFDSQWLVARGYLRAERGALELAVADFAAAHAKGALEAPELRRLADWSLALDRLDDRAKALRAYYAQLDEGSLSQILHRAAQAQQRRGEEAPPPLEPEVFAALGELFRRSPHPHNHAWVLQQLYQATKDHRVLTCIADGLLGATAQKGYLLLQGTRQLLDQVHEEATCDAIVARIEALLPGASGTDARLLRLFRVQIALRAGQVLNQPGPHHAAALAALRAAGQGTWLAGERLQMAQYLADLGALPTPELRAARLTELRALHQATSPADAERVQLALQVARAQWVDGAQEDALAFLLAGLDERRERFGCRYEQEARAPYEQAWSWQLELAQFLVAERFVEQDRASASGQPQQWLTSLVHETWIRALERDGKVSLGDGRRLFHGARTALIAAVDDADGNSLHAALQRVIRIHRAAHGRKLGDAPELLRAYARESFPQHARRQPMQLGPARELAQAIRELAGALPAIEFALATLDAEPTWLRNAGNGFWSQIHWQLAQWRHEAGRLGAVEPRLLALFCRELERELRTSRHGWTGFADRDHSYFWGEQETEFLRVARNLAELEADDGAILRNVAHYLWEGLHRFDEAIALAQRTEAAGLYDDDGRFELAQWLVSQKRAAESLGLYDRLCSAHPDRFDYARGFVLALHGSGRVELAEQRFTAVEAELRKRGHHDHGTLDQLAHLAAECSFREHERRLLTEVVRLVEPRGSTDQLGWYQVRLARACIADGDPAAGIEPASAALVAFRRNKDLRDQGNQVLREVLAALPDLAEFVRLQDARAAETGQDVPVLRKALGALLLERRDYGAAAAQLRLAAELAPADLDCWRMLAGAHERRRDTPARAEALLAAIEQAPLELTLYAEVASLLSADDRERALTSGVDVLFEEAAPHQQLAEKRTEQRRHGDAVLEWRQVVRLRREEPDGWLSLAHAQLASGDRAGARATFEQMLAERWESRFGDVHGNVRRELGRM